MSVFEGGFRLDEAIAVTGVSIPAMARLVDASLLRVTPSGRYEQHPLVHRFAREKLADDTELEREMRDRHARHFLTTVAKDAASLRTLQQGALARFDAMFENVRRAWARCLDAVSDLPAASDVASDVASGAALTNAPAIVPAVASDLQADAAFPWPATAMPARAWSKAGSCCATRAKRT